MYTAVSFIRLRDQEYHEHYCQVRLFAALRFTDANKLLTPYYSALYSIIMEHFQHFSTVVEACMNDAINVMKSFKDPNMPVVLQKDLLGSQVIASLAKVLFE